jgi:hypothetical protein
MFKPRDYTKKRLKIPKGQSESFIEEHKAQWSKEKCTKGKTTIDKTYIWSKSSSNSNPIKDLGEFRCSRKACRSSSTSGTRRVNLVANPIISREYGNDQEVLPTNGTYRCSLWHRYFITVNHVMVVTVTFSKWWLQLYQKELLFQ